MRLLDFIYTGEVNMSETIVALLPSSLQRILRDQEKLVLSTFCFFWKVTNKKQGMEKSK